MPCSAAAIAITAEWLEASVGDLSTNEYFEVDAASAFGVPLGT